MKSHVPGGQCLTAIMNIVGDKNNTKTLQEVKKIEYREAGLFIWKQILANVF